MIPNTIMYTYLGSGLRSLTEVASGNVEKSLPERVFFWFGLTITVVTTALYYKTRTQSTESGNSGQIRRILRKSNQQQQSIKNTFSGLKR